MRAIAREIKRAGVDHVAVTGDLTNLALETEFEAVRELLEDELGLHPSEVSVVPGNHDLYTRGAMRGRRFVRYFGAYVESELQVEPSRLCLIACHTWDTLGAVAAGWEAALIKRVGNDVLGVGPQPQIVGNDLNDVADQLIARHRGRT